MHRSHSELFVLSCVLHVGGTMASTMSKIKCQTCLSVLDHHVMLCSWRRNGSLWLENLFIEFVSQCTFHATLCKTMCRDPGSNRGPSDLQSDALPTELSRLCYVDKQPSLNVMRHCKHTRTFALYLSMRQLNRHMCTKRLEARRNAKIPSLSLTA